MKTLAEALVEIDLLRARLDAIELASGLFVTDADLDRPRGRLRINFDPKNWRGPSHKGRQAAACDPAFLDAYADAMTWMADHPKDGADPKWSEFNRKDAARARSWARRIRAKAAATAPTHAPGTRPPSTPPPAPRHDPATGELFDDGQPDPDLFDDDDDYDSDDFLFEDPDHG